MFYKPMRFPEKLYENMRNLISDNETTNRDFFSAAVQENLLEVRRLLLEAGSHADEGERKLMRLSIYKETLDALTLIAEETGTDSTFLLFCCIRRKMRETAPAVNQNEPAVPNVEVPKNETENDDVSHKPVGKYTLRRLRKGKRKGCRHLVQW